LGRLLLTVFPTHFVSSHYTTRRSEIRRWSSAASLSGTMLAMLLVSLISAFILLCMFIPSVRMALMAVDDTLEAHEAGLSLVATRKPFRESGPPQNMAQLIMLRHKMHQSNARRRKSAVNTRQSSRTYSITPVRPKASWIRFRRTFGAQYH